MCDFGKAAIPELVRLLEHEEEYVRREGFMYIEIISRIDFDWMETDERAAIDRIKSWWQAYRDQPLFEPDDAYSTIHWTKFPELTYEPPHDRRARILENYSKLHVGMRRLDAEELLGRPDHIQGRPWCIIYYLRVNQGPLQQIAIYYDRASRAVTRVVPSNLPGLEAIE